MNWAIAGSAESFTVVPIKKRIMHQTTVDSSYLLLKAQKPVRVIMD